MIRRGGFTLLEVMVAVGILAMVGLVTVGVMRSTLDLKDVMDEGDTVQQSARVALARITRELQLAFVANTITPTDTYQTLFVARDEDPVDTLWFTSLSHRRLYMNSRESDQTEITLWGEPDPETSELSVLLHREAPRIDEEPDEAGIILPLSYGVRSLDFMFLNGQTGDWKDEWDTRGVDTPRQLPRAIKVVLVLAAPDRDERILKEETFVTTVLLEYAEPMKRSLFGKGMSGGS